MKGPFMSQRLILPFAFALSCTLVAALPVYAARR